MRIPSLDTVSPKLERIAKLAKEAPQMVITSLSHHIDIDWMHEAYRRTRKDGALGVDGMSAEQYAANLEENLQSLLNRAKSGTYRAPPVKRVYIPKGDGSQTRPIGIPTFEDKVLQRAAAMALEAVYEQDFLDCSYGFRPGRSAHQALEALQHELVCRAGGWVLEVDIEQFFNTIDHARLREILGQRVRDGVLLLRLVSPQPAPGGGAAVGNVVVEATRTLRVLRHHRELGRPQTLSRECRVHLEKVARSPLEPGAHVLGTNGLAAGALPASTSATISTLRLATRVANL